jgi:hypothetical protein
MLSYYVLKTTKLRILHTQWIYEFIATLKIRKYLSLKINNCLVLMWKQVVSLVRKAVKVSIVLSWFYTNHNRALNSQIWWLKLTNARKFMKIYDKGSNPSYTSRSPTWQSSARISSNNSMYLLFVTRLPQDCHTNGRNMKEVLLSLKYISTYLCLANISNYWVEFQT